MRNRKPKTRSTYSQCPFQVLVVDKAGNYLSTATAFHFVLNEEWFLITNRHVVSGRDSFTDESLGGEPMKLVLKLASYVRREEGVFAVAPHDLSLYEGETPVWLEHPDAGPKCDVVAIRVERPAGCPDFMHNAANKISKDNLPISPGRSVFIIGFPQSISVGYGLPLWKSGYIASEHEYDVDLNGEAWEFGGMRNAMRVPAFFVDAQTRKGMSGSPVFARYSGPWDMVDPYATLNFDAAGFWDRDDVVLSGEGTQFVGCYSCRIVGKSETEAALGLCWREDVIETICRQGKRAKNPHIRYAS